MQTRHTSYAAQALQNRETTEGKPVQLQHGQEQVPLFHTVSVYQQLSHYEVLVMLFQAERCSVTLICT